LKIIVQKFGGTSLATQELRERVAAIVKKSKEEGLAPVVVVSAIGRNKDPYATDTLLNMIKDTNANPSLRETDLLLACGELISGVLLVNQLLAMDVEARYVSGQQAGIVTDGQYGAARILYVDAEKLISLLENNITPVVAGFQGVSENDEITTLGRGGSDITASALGAGLQADIVDIFTDVEGVMTADPRIVKNARLLDAVTYNEICQLAREGAKVVHPRAIEIAMQNNIPLRVRSTTQLDSAGTLVTNSFRSMYGTVPMIADRLITGVTYASNIVQVKIENDALKNNIADTQLRVFQTLAKKDISVDFISVQPHMLVFTVPEDLAEVTAKILNDIDIFPHLEFNCAKIAVVGAAMTGVPGIMAKILEALHDHNIPLLQSGDSYTNIWCLVARKHMEEAVAALHDKFALGKNSDG
jgi:aspartate kinase